VVRIDSPAGAIIAAPAPCPRRADQHAGVDRQAAGQRADREQRGAGDQQPPAAEQVGGPAAEQQEPAVAEQVAAEDPLQVLHRESQVAADRRQRDIHDRRIHDVEELDRAQEQQREPAAAGGEDRSGLGGHGLPPGLY
jgi:hypothetical protein